MHQGIDKVQERERCIL